MYYMLLIYECLTDFSRHSYRDYLLIRNNKIYLLLPNVLNNT